MLDDDSYWDPKNQEPLNGTLGWRRILWIMVLLFVLCASVALI